MKKFLILLPILLMLTTTGCRTTKVEYIIVLPPRPEREEIKAPTTVKECAEIINYYEHLVQLWEAWGDTVDATIEKLNDPEK